MSHQRDGKEGPVAVAGEPTRQPLTCDIQWLHKHICNQQHCYCMQMHIYIIDTCHMPYAIEARCSVMSSLLIPCHINVAIQYSNNLTSEKHTENDTDNSLSSFCINQISSETFSFYSLKKFLLLLSSTFSLGWKVFFNNQVGI